ncbi:MAG: 3-oxoacyl-[acyl-carrier-protein] synthase III C-terminal domain-containing protein, partial [Candidatus Bathyarchaeia archaeon]
MVGISSYGVHIPIWRIRRELLGGSPQGERSVAGKDEDSLTMAVAAALDCIGNMQTDSIDGVFFASTTSPFKEKSVSATIAAVIGLHSDVFTADFSGSLRAGTGALKLAFDMVKSNSARQVLVTAADCRLGAPGSSLEQTFGDGAAALLIGKDGQIADLKFSTHVYDEIYDFWRRDVDLFVNSWEDRYVYSCGYLRVVKETVSKLMNDAGLSAKELTKAALPIPDLRRGLELARSLGLDPKVQLQDPLMDTIGNTGTAQPLMLLAAALEQSNPGDKLLMASYGSGS